MPLEKGFPNKNQRDWGILTGAEMLHSASNVSYRLAQHTGLAANQIRE